MAWKDENGNLVASVFGGPYDGHVWLVQEAIEGDKFCPLKTEVNRPIYIYTNGKWCFSGYEREGTWSNDDEHLE